MGCLVVIVVAAFAVSFVYLPVDPAPLRGGCAGGLGCVHEVSLSCIVFGFGVYANYFGDRFFTYDCAGFLKPLL